MLMAKSKPSTSSKKTTSASSAKSTNTSDTAVSSNSLEKKNEIVSSSEYPSHDALLNEFGTFMAKLQQVGNNLNSLRSSFKQLEKNVHKELKNAQKLSKKSKLKQIENPVDLLNLLVLVRS